MASLRQIRGRIKSIQSSKQIMRAMQLVSGSKLKRSQDRLVQGRTVLEFLDGMLGRVLAASASVDGPSTADTSAAKAVRAERSAGPDGGPASPAGTVPPRSVGTPPVADTPSPAGRVPPRSPDHPLCRVFDGPTTLVVFTSDAGLCGSYNSNLIQLAEAHLRRDAARATQLVFIGKRAWRYFTKRGYAAAEAYLDLAGRPNPATAERIGRGLMRRFLDGQTASVSLLYSRFLSATVYRPVIEPWLPIQFRPPASGLRPPLASDDYLFEPSAARVFEELLPRWALATFQHALLEAFTSEHSARMLAMKNATDNAQDLLNALTRQRNKIRQAAITKELSEIVGTAEALK